MSLHILKTTKNLLFKNIFAYLVIVLVTPALTRMYEPSQFGTLSLMIFFSSFLSVLFTARLELAIPIVKEPLSLNCLIKMLLCSTFVFCFIMSLIVFVFIDDILKLFFSQESYGNWLLITPFYGLILSISSIFMMVLTKEMNFHEMGLSLLLQNCAFCFLAVMLSYFSVSFNGLIVSKCVGSIASVIFISMVIKYKIRELFFLNLEFRHIKKITRDLKKFIQFNFPISIMGVVGKDLMILIFAYSQGVTYAGFYAIARAVAELPTSMISSALGPIFYSEAANSFNGLNLKNEVSDQVMVIFKFLFTVLIPTYLILSIWAVEIFKFLFGSNWEMSGIIFLYLLPLSIISIFSCWLTRLFEVLGRQNVSFKIQIIFEGFGFALALALIYYGIEAKFILAFAATCFSFVPILITLHAFKWLGFKMTAICRIAFIFISFSILNAFITTIYSDTTEQKFLSIWLIISAFSFHLIGRVLFKGFRLRDINVFS